VRLYDVGSTDVVGLLFFKLNLLYITIHNGISNGHILTVSREEKNNVQNGQLLTEKRALGFDKVVQT